ncbi:hypothetical protein HELRODRAFT_126902, partial [Helobdella robusta]|uniref:RING-type E3 ubiquitin transferase n=1 Tax=Helobdella robusta TaxID=6412 RepID=T1EHB6_HELRO
CAICLDTFVKGAYVHKLHCGHPYHERCIQKWKKQRTTCPTCRFEMRDEFSARSVITIEKKENDRQFVQIEIL